MDETEDTELLGMLILRDIRMCNEELLKKREQVTELIKKNQAYAEENEDLKMRVKKSESEVREGLAQLGVRTEATQRLEQHNATLRDKLAKLQVQAETNAAERDALIQRWQTAESERKNWKAQCEELQEEAAATASYKEQCLLLQNQIRATVNRTAAQQEACGKDMIRLERATQEAVSFAQKVESHSKLKDEKMKELASTVTEAQDKLILLSTVIVELRKELEDERKTKRETCDNQGPYFDEWINYQKEMHKRVEGLMGENERLGEELGLATAAMTHTPVCLYCVTHMPPGTEPIL